MLSRKKKTQMPPFLEGTQGVYVKRASPPPVPSCNSQVVSSIFKKSPPPPDSRPLPSTLSTVSASLAGAAGKPTVQRTPTMASTGSQHSVAPPAERPALSHTPSINTGSSSLNVAGSCVDLYNESPTALFPEPYEPQVAFDFPDFDVAGAAGAGDAPSTSRLSVHRASHDDPPRAFPTSPTGPATLSSQSFSHNHREMRRTLTPSLSIGNMAAGQHLPSVTRPVSSSLQSLPGRSISTSIIGTDSILSGAPEEELELPPNWALEVNQDGIRYYVDHTNRRTHWLHPLAVENLPPGWKKVFRHDTGVVYYNEVEGRSQLEHPGLARPVARTESMMVAATKGRGDSTIENLNIIQEDVPEWLRMFAGADSSLDHLLEWNLFNDLQLEQYEQMMLKLYKQEVIDVVIRYERMRRELNKEIVRRTQPRPM